MLLVFIGQVTVASALPCQMDMPDDSVMMDHSSHMMPAQADDSATDNCCAKNSSCSMSGCIFLALPVIFQSTKVLFASESIESPAQQAVNQFPTSLYRPPILG
jgi:hypothetical protein